MEVRASIEDQFSKLHPIFPTETRIGIIGAGPSGLSAAYALCKLGYTNVTILEKHQHVGGMCESIEIEGKVYDLGGQVLASNSAPTIFHLAKEIGAETEELDDHKVAIIDSATGEYDDTKLVDDYVPIISLTLKLQDEVNATGRIGVYAASELASEPTPQFLEANGFKSVPKFVAYGYTASGYGYVQDMPYAYIHEFTRTSMAAKIRRFRGGYTSVWQRISENLPIKVHCNTEVLEVKRNSSNVSIHVTDGTNKKQVMQFDKVIISGSFPLYIGKTYRSSSTRNEENVKNLMDMSELEQELFSKVETIDYYTTALKIDGLEHIPKGFYYFWQSMDDPAYIGYPVAMQRFYSDTNIYLFWSYGNSEDITGKEVTNYAVNTVKSIGGKVEKLILQRRFKYFPHVNSQDMKDGFYDKLECQLQGQRNTYYVGGLMAFELTERNSSYSMALMTKHFATETQPKFPYVKRLFTMRSNNVSWISRQLIEAPEVEFPDLSSLDGFLRHWGTHASLAKKTLYNWINEKGEVSSQRTFRELHANASYIAHKLSTNQKPVIKPGDRVLLVYVPGLDFVDAFFGCLRARVIPVPAIPPDPSQTGGQALLHVQNIAKSSNAVAILSTFSYHVYVKAVSAKNKILPTRKGKDTLSWPDLPWLHTESWIKNSKTDRWHEEESGKGSEQSPNDLCFLQFTSGSTGDAKGVMITHGGVTHNVKLMRKRYKSTSKTVLVSWLPQYHDMGLIGGLFTSLVSGGSAILFSPTTFIKNPLLWLQTMSKFHATHSAGPNFAFELVVRRLESEKKTINKLDLSSMLFLMSAAEPVRSKTLKTFVELTQPFGLSEEVLAFGYGMAENSVYVSCAYGEGKPIFLDWQGRVCCGYVNPNDPDVDIRIVDPETLKEHEESGKEGEIWINSPSAGIGYWGMEELSQATFRNELPSQTGKLYTRSGDLGRVIDGKLFITGRIKDLMIVAGRNIYASDVEKTVESASELLRPGCCAVIGVPEDILLAKGITFPESSDQVGLVAIAEVRGDKTLPENIIERIRTRVTEEHGIIMASIVLIKARSICKTTSGKIKRYECLKQFTDGKLSVIEEPRLQKRSLIRSVRRSSQPLTTKDPISKSSSIGKKEIIEFLKTLLSEQTGISTERISVMESLANYGVDSIGVVRAAQKLSTFLGVPVGAIDIFTATCIDDLADFAENLLIKSRPQSFATPLDTPEINAHISELFIEVSLSHKLSIWLFQILALVYISILLMFPAYLSVFAFMNIISKSNVLIDKAPWFGYLIPLACAPLAWIFCIFSTGISIAFFGNSFLQPNYALNPDISIWSIDFIKWWALYKAQELSSRVLAVHLRGTVFLKYWFEMLGAKIGSSVLLDTVDITDPYMVVIGDGAVIAEGALIQSHEMKNGILSFRPIRIGQNSSVGPYAVIQKGSTVGDGAEVAALQKCEGSRIFSKTAKASKFEKGNVLQEIIKERHKNHEWLYQFLGIYMVGFLSSLSATITYLIYLWLDQKAFSMHQLSFLCICSSIHWLPFSIVTYAIIFNSVPIGPINFATIIAIAHLSHGIIFSILSSILTRVLLKEPVENRAHLLNWFRHQITITSHTRFAKFLSGTEAFCMYLRLMGAKIGQHCSIRAINPLSDPELISIGDGVHLGDFSRIIPGFYNSKGFIRGHIKVQDNSVVGSQGLILPGSVIEENVILGALSVAPMDSVLRKGGVFVGSQSPVMVKNVLHTLDDRIEEMDTKYQKVLGNLAANLAATTLKVKARYFHRIGASGKGTLSLYEDISVLPEHKLFSSGKKYPVLIRHSNCLSSDDDARLDPRGAALRILSESDGHSSLLDLTLKTGKAFHARSIGDFATWLVCGVEAREEHVKYAPHIRDAMWDSLRRANSYTELHYYSNICRLLRFEDGQEMYVKFKLRPFNEKIGEESGKVDPIGILPPETGAIPRDENDMRPLLFLDDDFQRRVHSPEKVRYVLQFQLHPVAKDEDTRETVLDCTKPWDENEFPYSDIGEIIIDQVLTTEESNKLEFNPYLRSHEVDVIRATSCTQSASMDHGRSIVYSICQHLRNKKPLPEAWRNFLDHSDVQVNLSGCPMAATWEEKDVKKVTLARTWYQNLWLMSAQPLLQVLVPYFLMGLIIFAPLKGLIYMKEIKKLELQWLLPFFWILSGTLAGLVCALAKWVLVGKKKEGETVMIWSRGVYLDTIWQAIRTLVGEYFMEMTTGSFLFGFWMNLMGSKVDWEHGAYVDSTGSILNPEMVRIEGYGSVEREALIFGHIYDGEGGKVKFGKVSIGEGGFMGSRGVAMPGVIVEPEGSLGALSLAMKEEIIT